MDLIAQLARELNLKAANVEAAVKLIDEGNTIPFISRYRKEATGGMDDVALRALDERLSYLRNLEQRKEDVILLIDAQGKLTPELEQQIREAAQLQRVEDLYKPYRKKRMTRAQKAREAGLEPLANMIIMQASAKGSALDTAAAYVNEEAGFDTPEKALAGAADIVAETVAEDPENVADLRAFTQNTADIVVEATDPAEKTPYEPYYSYDEPLRRIPNHRVLAIDRGEREGKLRVRVNVDGAAATARLGSRWPRRQGVFAPIFDAAIADGYKRLMAPSLEREARAKLTVRAQTEAINVFAKNLEGLLSARPSVAPAYSRSTRATAPAARSPSWTRPASCSTTAWSIPPSRATTSPAPSASSPASSRRTASTLSSSATAPLAARPRKSSRSSSPRRRPAFATPSSTRPAHRYTPPPSSQARSIPTWTSPCAAP